MMRRAQFQRVTADLIADLQGENDDTTNSSHNNLPEKDSIPFLKVFSTCHICGTVSEKKQRQGNVEAHQMHKEKSLFLLSPVARSELRELLSLVGHKTVSGTFRINRESFSNTPDNTTCVNSSSKFSQNLQPNCNFERCVTENKAAILRKSSFAPVRKNIVSSGKKSGKRRLTSCNIAAINEVLKHSKTLPWFSKHGDSSTNKRLPLNRTPLICGNDLSFSSELKGKKEFIDMYGKRHREDVNGNIRSFFSRPLEFFRSMQNVESLSLSSSRPFRSSVSRSPLAISTLIDPGDPSLEKKQWKCYMSNNMHNKTADDYTNFSEDEKEETNSTEYVSVADAAPFIFDLDESFWLSSLMESLGVQMYGRLCCVNHALKRACESAWASDGFLRFQAPTSTFYEEAASFSQKPAAGASSLSASAAAASRLPAARSQYHLNIDSVNSPSAVATSLQQSDGAIAASKAVVATTTLESVPGKAARQQPASVVVDFSFSAAPFDSPPKCAIATATQAQSAAAHIITQAQSAAAPIITQAQSAAAPIITQAQSAAAPITTQAQSGNSAAAVSTTQVQSATKIVSQNSSVAVLECPLDCVCEPFFELVKRSGEEQVNIRIERAPLSAVADMERATGEGIRAEILSEAPPAADFAAEVARLEIHSTALSSAGFESDDDQTTVRIAARDVAAARAGETGAPVRVNAVKISTLSDTCAAGAAADASCVECVESRPATGVADKPAKVSNVCEGGKIAAGFSSACEAEVVDSVLCLNEGQSIVNNMGAGTRNAAEKACATVCCPVESKESSGDGDAEGEGDNLASTIRSSSRSDRLVGLAGRRRLLESFTRKPGEEHIEVRSSSGSGFVEARRSSVADAEKENFTFETKHTYGTGEFFAADNGGFWLRFLRRNFCGLFNSELERLTSQFRLNKREVEEQAALKEKQFSMNMMTTRREAGGGTKIEKQSMQTEKRSTALKRSEIARGSEWMSEPSRATPWRSADTDVRKSSVRFESRTKARAKDTNKGGDVAERGLISAGALEQVPLEWKEAAGVRDRASGTDEFSHRAEIVHARARPDEEDETVVEISQFTSDRGDSARGSEVREWSSGEEGEAATGQSSILKNVLRRMNERETKVTHNIPQGSQNRERDDGGKRNSETSDAEEKVLAHLKRAYLSQGKSSFFWQNSETESFEGNERKTQLGGMRQQQSFKKHRLELERQPSVSLKRRTLEASEFPEISQTQRRVKVFPALDGFGHFSSSDSCDAPTEITRVEITSSSRESIPFLGCNTGTSSGTSIDSRDCRLNVGLRMEESSKTSSEGSADESLQIKGKHDDVEPGYLHSINSNTFQQHSSGRVRITAREEPGAVAFDGIFEPAQHLQQPLQLRLQDDEQQQRHLSEKEPLDSLLLCASARLSSMLLVSSAQIMKKWQNTGLLAGWLWFQRNILRRMTSAQLHRWRISSSSVITNAKNLRNFLPSESANDVSLEPSEGQAKSSEHIAWKMTTANWELLYESVLAEMSYRARLFAEKMLHFHYEMVAAVKSMVNDLFDIEQHVLCLPAFCGDGFSERTVSSGEVDFLSANKTSLTAVKLSDGGSLFSLQKDTKMLRMLFSEAFALIKGLNRTWDEYEEWAEMVCGELDCLDFRITQEREACDRAWPHTPNLADAAKLQFRNSCIFDSRLMPSICLSLYSLIHKVEEEVVVFPPREGKDRREEHSLSDVRQGSFPSGKAPYSRRPVSRSGVKDYKIVKVFEAVLQQLEALDVLDDGLSSFKTRQMFHRFLLTPVKQTNARVFGGWNLV